MGTVVRREQCPMCAEEGRDSRGDNLHVYDDGGKYCHAGHGRIRNKSETKEIRMEPKVSIADCMSNPVGHDADRCVSKEIYEAYDIRFACDTATGKLKRLYYPYKTLDGTVTGVKVRLKDSKDFFVVGKLGGLFGKHLFAKFPKGALFITEGEEDALALKTILSGTPLAGHDVGSLPNGADMSGKIDKDTMADLETFQKYKQIVICLDTDTPGKATAKRLAEWLVGFTPNVKVIDLPLKDASDCLKAGRGAEVIDLIKSTPKYSPEGIVHGSSISIGDILRAAPEGYSTPFYGINDKLHGVRKGEILTVCAASGIGKSTLVTEIAYDLVVRHGLKVCHIALENVLEATASQYVAMDCNIPVSKFRSDTSCISESDVEAALERTVHKMYFFKHFGSIDTHEFKSKLLYYARAGVDFIILDHLSMVISGSDVANERKEIDKIMTDLASMVVETGVGLINVVHLKRKESGNKDRGLNEGGQVSLTDLRGSAALEQLSWGVLAMERNQQAEDGSEDYSYLRVLKNRTWGRTGKAGRVKYVHETGRLIDAPEEIENHEVHGVSTPEEAVEAEEKSCIEALDEILSGTSFSGSEERLSA